MKKIMLTVLVAVITMVTVKAQENIVKFNPLALVVGSIELGYETAITDKSSVQVDLGYVNFNSSGLDYTGFGAGLQYRMYLQDKDVLVGWFAGPYASYASSKANDLKVSVLSGGAVVGYQWNWNPITLDLYGGPGYFSVDADEQDFDFGFDGFGLKLGFSIGYSF